VQDDLPPSFVLLGWTELSGIVFFHATIVASLQGCQKGGSDGQ